MKVCNNNVAAIEAVLVTDVRAIHSAKWKGHSAECSWRSAEWPFHFAEWPFCKL